MTNSRSGDSAADFQDRSGGSYIKLSRSRLPLF
jgi:hypothetical protein